ncbi:MAG: glutathione S-transferase, partial [Burkholderiales bacterium PBB5]
RGSRWADLPESQADMRAKVPQTMTACAQLLEAQREAQHRDGPWVLGQRYSVADAYLFTVASWLEADGVDTQALPRLLAHRAQRQARPAVQRALAEAAPA